MRERREPDKSIGPGKRVARNPCARLVSDHLWRHKLRRHYPRSGAQCLDSFEASLRAIPLGMDGHWPERMHLAAGEHQANRLIHMRPQYRYGFETEGCCLVGEVLCFETLAHDVHRLLAVMRETRLS